MEKLTAKRSPRQAPAKGVLAPKGVPESVEGVALGERSSLLYLNSNNSTESIFSETSKLSPYHRKQAFCLSDNCERFIAKVGLSHVGFLTLTFPDNVTDNKEAGRRFNIFRLHFLSRFFGAWMLVKERQQRGAWHYHLLIDCRTDIRTGVNWDELEKANKARGRGNYSKAASPVLRSIWSILRERLPAYGLGRSELLPIRTTAEATSKYLGKYISKHIGAREEKDKGVRLTSYSADFSKSTPKMSWNSAGGKEWRRKVAKFAVRLGYPSPYELQAQFGATWAFNLQDYIMQIDDYSTQQIRDLKKTLLRGNITPVECTNFHICRVPTHHVFGDNLVDLDTGEILF